MASRFGPREAALREHAGHDLDPAVDRVIDATELDAAVEDELRSVAPREPSLAAS